jgi:hypothetical protein
MMPTPGKSTPTGQTQSVFGRVVPNENNESHEESISRSLRERLKGVCGKLSREDFEALIAKMTHEQLRGEKSSRR